jgi:hypothetical protein
MSWVSFSTIIYVAAACYKVSALIAGIIMGLTARVQYSSVHNTCCVLVICFLSTSGLLSGGGMS